MSLPYLTRDIPGTGGALKARAEDFFVQELPLYEASGEGEHVYCEVQKTGLTTFDAVDQLGRALDIWPRDIGFAGMKDAHAVTRQLFSIPRTTPEAVMAVKIPNMSVLWAARHGNKLRLGHLAGNRFAIKIRDVAATDVVKLQPAIDILQKRGMPNYFGEQRFGRRADNHLLGAALIRGDDAGLLKLLLGSPNAAIDDAQTLGARKAFDAGQYEQAMRLMPRRSGMERRVLARFIKKNDASAAVRAVDERIRRLWVSALQSDLFNQVVAQRIGTLDHLIDGDLAEKRDSGGVFLVESAAAEQPRCDAFEISPTGPLVGYRMTLPEHEPLRIEQEAFATVGLQPADFRSEGRHKVKGARRSLRVKPENVEIAGGADEHGPHITVAFTLPPGSFATVMLREVMKMDEED